jgi:hypothetical protein
MADNKAFLTKAAPTVIRDDSLTSSKVCYDSF